MQSMAMRYKLATIHDEQQICDACTRGSHRSLRSGLCLLQSDRPHDRSEVLLGAGGEEPVGKPQGQESRKQGCVCEKTGPCPFFFELDETLEPGRR